MDDNPINTRNIANNRRWQAVSIIALLGLVAAYIHAELYTVHGPFIKVRDWGIPPTWALIVQNMRWFFRVIAVVSLITLVIAESRWIILSNMIRKLIGLRFGVGFILLVLGVVSGVYFLLPGYITAATDGIYYTTLAWLIKDVLANFQLPIWSNWGDMGFPLMQFYSPLFFALVALVNFVVPNIFVGIKFVFFAIHVLSLFAMYLYVHNLTHSKSAGLIAAFTYGFAYYRYHVIVYVNKFPMVPTFLLWPLQLYLVDRVICGEGRHRSGISLAVITAIGLTCHTFFGGYSVIFASIYGGIRLFSIVQDRALFGIRMQAARRLVFWFTLGVLASLASTLPPLTEVNLTVIPGWYPDGFIAMPVLMDTTPWAATFTFYGSQGSGWVYGYVGISIVVLAILGGVLSFVRVRLVLIAPLIVLGLTLFLALGPVAFFLSAQGQYLVYVVIIGSAGVGILAVELRHRMSIVRARTLISRKLLSQSRLFIPTLICALVAVDMFRYNLFVNYLVPPTPNGSPVNRVAVHEWLSSNRGDNTGRVLDPSQPENGWQIPMVAGLAGYENNGSSSIFSANFIRNLRSTNPNPSGVIAYSVEELLSSASDLLLIANTDWVVTDKPTSLQAYPGAVTTDDGAVIIPTGGGLPLIASKKIEIVEQQVQFVPIAREMGINADNGSAEFIPILEDDFIEELVESSNPNLESHVIDHVIQSQYVRIDYSLSSTAYLQLSYSYYPYLRVMIDGIEVRKFPTAFGLIGIVAPEGFHVIEIEPYLSPLRRVTYGISVATFLFLVSLYVRSLRRIETMTL
jgi:hypothetical protein